MRRGVAGIVLATAAVSGLTACGAGGTGVEAGDARVESPTSSTVASSTAAPVAAAGTEPVVTNPGQQPRMVLRLALAEQSSFQSTDVLTQDVLMEIDGESRQFDNAFGTTSVIEVERVVGERIELAVTVESVDPGGLPGTMKELEGFACRQQIDDRGHVLATEVDPAKALSTQEQAFLDALVSSSRNNPVLPREAVGVGATWTQTGVLPLFDQGTEVVRRFTLVAVEGTTVKVEVAFAIDTELDDPSVVFGPLPDVDEVGVLRMTGEATGTLTFDLARPAPSSSTDMVVEMRLPVVRGGVSYELMATIHQSYLNTVTPL